MEKPYARVGENGVGYSGPSLPDEKTTQPQIGVFGSDADEIVSSPETARWLRTLNAHGQNLSLIPISSVASWGKASDDLVKAVYQERVLAVLALDRPSSHLAEQIAVKAFVPVIAISSDSGCRIALRWNRLWDACRRPSPRQTEPGQDP